MQLHRPKDINSLNEDFFKNEFSGSILTEDTAQPEKEQSYPENNIIQGEIDSIIVEHESDIKSGYVAKQLEKLSNAEYTNDDRIFHDFSQDDFEENELLDKLDEKNLFESFPEIDFDPSVFNDDDLSERELRKESVRKAKEEAKATIENEKEKIKEQKKLEKKVQKPFEKRRTTITLMIVFIIANLLCISLCGIFSSMAKNGNTLTLSPVTLQYVDGISISSSNHKGKIIAVTSDNIQGSQTVLFTDEAGTQTIGKVIAIGDGVYGIDIGEKVVRAEKENILGIVKLSTPDIATVYQTIAVFGNILFIVLLIILLLTVLLSALRIKKLNREIKELNENYNII